jgi:hypothetical protein
MERINLKSSWSRGLLASAGASALLFTFGCTNARDLSGTTTQAATASQTALPVVVSCEPHQRTIVRPTVVNGTPVSQVECIAAEATAQVATQNAQPGAVVPAAYRTVAPSQPVERGLADTDLIRPATPASIARPVPANQRVVYRDERPERPARSATKSAVIIGSSAGVGAGVGAAIGGKKGALIGAAITGGGAAIWDQVTRRR